jgi:hypothetical protein
MNSRSSDANGDGRTLPSPAQKTRPLQATGAPTAPVGTSADLQVVASCLPGSAGEPHRQRKQSLETSQAETTRPLSERT